ncbi:MAG TPA: hypothetical protein VGF02_14755 [Pseudolabrys sp.]
MPEFIASAITTALTEWGLILLALAFFAGAVAALIYVPLFGNYIAMALFVLGGGCGGYSFGFSARGSLDNSGAIQAQLDEANRELTATQKIATDTAARAQAANDLAQSNQGKVDAYEAKLKAEPETGGCGLSDDDVRSLSNIGASSAPDAPLSPVDVRPAGQAANPK